MRKFLLLLAASFAAACGAQAQDHPSRPVPMVVGFPPGGGTDIVAHYISCMSRYLTLLPGDLVEVVNERIGVLANRVTRAP